MKRELDRQKAIHEERKTSSVRSKRRDVEYFVDNRQLASQKYGFPIEQTTFEPKMDDLQYRLDVALIKEKKAFAGLRKLCSSVQVVRRHVESFRREVPTYYGQFKNNLRRSFV